jgi:DNA mismatch repair protein MutS
MKYLTFKEFLAQKNQIKSALLNDYAQYKSRHYIDIVFYRVGDFYEVFFDDAKYVADCCDLTLNARTVAGLDNARIYCVGVPYCDIDNYVTPLAKKGFLVVKIDNPNFKK